VERPEFEHTTEDESVLPSGPDPAAPANSPTVAARGNAAVGWAINAFSTLLAVATMLLLSKGPLHGEQAISGRIPELEMFFVLTIAWTGAVWAPVQLHHRGNTHLFVLEEVPMLVGLVFLSPQLLVLSCVLANLLALGLLRKQAPIKLFFNVASGALSAAVSAVVFRAILGSHSPVSLLGWVAAAAALCAESVITVLAVRVVMKLNGQSTERRSPIQLTMEMLLMAASICLSFVVLDAAWFNPWGTVPLFLVAGLIIVAYRGYARLNLRFASLQRLYDFSRVLGSSSLDPSSMSSDVLREMCTVMRARRAELILAEPSGIPRRVSLDGDGNPSVEPIGLDEGSIITRAIVTGTASLHHAAPQLGRPAAVDPIAGEYREAIVAPLMNGLTAIGAVAVIDRDEELDSFDHDDLRLFETLAAHASTSLERTRLVEELRYEVDSKSHQATHDALTGLPNRMLFMTRAEAALNQGGGVAIVLLDVDRFKDVNDTLGHAIGDRLLCEISERLLRTAAGRATVARLGGDEFALLITDVVESASAVDVVDDLNREISRPIEMDGLTLAVGASAGIALAPAHGNDVALLLQRADIAMYLAKERRNAVEVYSFEQDQSMQRWLLLGGLLTQAVARGDQLSVAYQPIADVQTGAVMRVEALARWMHPVHGQIPPDEFIRIAEQIGLMPQISEFVLSTACAQLAELRRAGLFVGLAVNLSGRELADAGIVTKVERHLRLNRLPAEVLTLEITETEVMSDLGEASRVLDELAALGVHIAIDDYGTGYSSLAYIHHLPIQELKIDRSFVTNLPGDISNAIIVRSSIAMAHSLGLSVVAEGAEDEVTCALLADADCDAIQGHFLAKAMPGDQLEAWLRAGPRLALSPSAFDRSVRGRRAPAPSGRERRGEPSSS
jgi:diguanylate cyclase (GGDEF)-like protein